MKTKRSERQLQQKKLSSIRTSNVEQLISQIKPNKYNAYLRVAGDNPGIATDQLSALIKSNNHHNASQYLNEVIIPLGWVIAKFPTDDPSQSWRWYLMPVKRALKLGIDKRLRLKIFSLLGAANDE